MSRPFSLLAASLLLVVGACSTEAKNEAPRVLNTKCPMMGEAVDPEGPMSDWHGNKVAYCCDGCQAKFEALSDEDQTTKLKDVGADL